MLTSPTGFLLVARSDHTTGSRNIKPKVLFNVQKMAKYALFFLIMGPFKGEVSGFSRLWPVRVRVRAYFTTGATRLAILATAGLLVFIALIGLMVPYSIIRELFLVPRKKY